MRRMERVMGQTVIPGYREITTEEYREIADNPLFTGTNLQLVAREKLALMGGSVALTADTPPSQPTPKPLPPR